MSPPALTTVATGIVVATGTVELMRSTVEAISYLTEKECRKCKRMVKKRELVKHLEDHLDEDEMLYATDKGALERKIERMAALEERLREEKAELLHKLETIDKEHKEEKKRLIKDKSKLKKELAHAKNEEARLKALALSEIKIQCDLCNQTVLAKDREYHLEIHRKERRMLRIHLSGKHSSTHHQGSSYNMQMNASGAKSKMLNEFNKESSFIQNYS